MSEIGATIFSKKFAEIIKKASNGIDISSSFYSSYDELKNDSPYMLYYRKNTND